jgi:hypothetical protein
MLVGLAKQFKAQWSKIFDDLDRFIVLIGASLSEPHIDSVAVRELYYVL